MLIDDNRIDLTINEMLLERSGYATDVKSFLSGAEALEYISREGPPVPYGFILLDIQMPQMTGYDVLKAFKSLPAEVQNAYCIVMLSSTVDPLDHLLVKTDPAALGMLPKPLTISALADIMYDWQHSLPK